MCLDNLIKKIKELELDKGAKELLIKYSEDLINHKPTQIVIQQKGFFNSIEEERKLIKNIYQNLKSIHEFNILKLENAILLTEYRDQAELLVSVYHVFKLLLDKQRDPSLIRIEKDGIILGIENEPQSDIEKKIMGLKEFSDDSKKLMLYYTDEIFEEKPSTFIGYYVKTTGFLSTIYDGLRKEEEKSIVYFDYLEKHDEKRINELYNLVEGMGFENKELKIISVSFYVLYLLLEERGYDLEELKKIILFKNNVMFVNNQECEINQFKRNINYQVLNQLKLIEIVENLKISENLKELLVSIAPITYKETPSIITYFCPSSKNPLLFNEKTKKVKSIEKDLVKSKYYTNFIDSGLEQEDLLSISACFSSIESHIRKINDIINNKDIFDFYKKKISNDETLYEKYGELIRFEEDSLIIDTRRYLKEHIK